MRRFQIVRSTTDTLTSHSGLALVGRALARTRLDKDLGTIALRHGIARDAASLFRRGAFDQIRYVELRDLRRCRRRD